MTAGYLYLTSFLLFHQSTETTGSFKILVHEDIMWNMADEGGERKNRLGR